ncbi:uncharacterized protein [Nerophis lumbriciformis]|uniref:uncharacterized protein n=1 Tax=Nerophis lumbriciformis TaxID=546530 RepID=UPI002ADFE0C1|nr:mitochondrial antiviral-signaling protein-like [Nerophis lumbriciformis]
MSFASDKLYNGYLRTNMPTIVSTVKVREMVVHLPCLTAHDRETIEARRQMCSNHDAMVLLLDCLKRRESWPEHFIKALEMCEHTSIAAEVRAAYHSLRGAHNSNPSSPSNVHQDPDDLHLPVPETSAGHSQDSAPPAPPQPVLNATPPPVTEAQPEASTTAAAPAPESAPESAPEPDRACLQESAEPETPDPARPGPEETSTSDFLNVLQVPTEQSDVVSDVTPEQKTDPPAEEVVTLEPEEHSQVCSVPDSTPTESTSEGSALPADDMTVGPSLPSPLLSAQPPTTYSVNTDRLEISDFAQGETSAVPEENSPEEEDVRVHVMHVTQQPSLLDLDGQSVGNGEASKDGAQPPTTYSGNTDRLEISDFAQGETSAEPEENPPEEEEVRVHVTQQPSLLDLGGQSVGNGEASKDGAQPATNYSGNTDRLEISDFAQGETSAVPEENPPEEEEARVHVTQQPSLLDLGGQSVGNGEASKDGAQPPTTYSGNTDRLEISDFAQGETSAVPEENPPEVEEVWVHVTQQPLLLDLGGQSVGNGKASKDGAQPPTTYSGNTDRLEISDFAQGETGAVPEENPPEEVEVRVHVTQQPSLLDLGGQSVGNGDTSKDGAQPPTTYSGNTDHLEISDFAQGETSAEHEENPPEEEEARVHVTQQPSLLDLDGQSVCNGEASKDGAQPPTTYSGNTDRLEISNFAQGQTSAEPEEKPPEEEEARVHVMHVTQQPLVLDLGGQSVGNGEASKDGAQPPTTYSGNTDRRGGAAFAP